ncbi:MAG: hypothetical protein CL927_15500 [Deltaproteobacteria bacterium]|nr:hypothetical protein [Deltaproteobacteria bacterium]HCH64392.1 hypothetical protein [Deltaproteobacteria bacterium]
MFAPLLWWAALAVCARAAPATPLDTTLEPEQSQTDLQVTSPESRPVRLVFTGASQGIGRNLPPTGVLNALAADAQPSGARITDAHGLHGVLAQGPHILVVDGTMRSAVAFLDGQPVACIDAAPPSGRRHATGHLLLEAPAPAPDWLSALGDVDQYQRQVCTHPSGASAHLTTRGDGPPVDWALGRWETREAVAGTLALAGRSVTFLAVGDPVLDHSRTLQAIRTAMVEDPATTIYVDAGSALDGASSVVDGAPSLHRATRLRDFQRVSPGVLVPGATELVLGATAFIEEQASFGLPYIASNWHADDPMRQLPSSHTIELAHPSGPIRIAFVGILDPALQNIHAGLDADGVRITDPVTDVQPIVAALEARAQPPHAIVALTTAGGDVQERIRRELRGVDLLLGDPTLATMRTTAREVELLRLDSARKGAAVTLPMDGLAVAELFFSAEDRYLERVRTVPVPLPEAAPTDPDATAAITAVRATHFPAQEVPLLGPQPEAAALETWTSALWHQMMCEAIRGGADGDIVVLDTLPGPPPAPGPVSELQALRQLALPDTLEVHRISGIQIQRLADRLAGLKTVTCGIQPGEKVWTVGPRWLEPERIYRVVTTHRAAATTPIGEILTSLESTRALDRPTISIVPTDANPSQPATLRSVALEELRLVRDTTGVGVEGVSQALLEDRPNTFEPLWLLRIRRLGVQSTSFSGVDDPAFATVPETLATSPSSYTFGSEADVAFEFSGPSILSDARAIGAFSRIRAGEEDPEELADDLLLSSSHSLPGLAFPTLPSLRMMPFSEVAYDSEFTAIEVEDGGTGMKQADLSLTLGISALRAGPIRSLRLGGFVNRDMARLDEKPSEFGGALDWETFQSFGPSVKWTTTADVALYANTNDDDPSDLRLRAVGDTRLLLPLATWLDIGAFGQVFAIRGRTDANDTLGVSTTWGVTLDMAGAFVL